MTHANDYFPGECRECDGYRYHLETCSQYREELSEAYRIRRALNVRDLGDKWITLDDTDALFALCGTSRSDKAEAMSGGFSTWARVNVAWTPNENGKRSYVAFLDRNDYLQSATVEQMHECAPERLIVITSAEYDQLAQANFDAERIEQAAQVREVVA